MDETKIRRAESPFESVDVKCHRCDHKWQYTSVKLKHLGKYPVYAQCPNCRTSVKVRFKKEEEKE